MGRYGRYKRKRKKRTKNIGYILVAVLIVGFIATSIGVTFYWYFKNVKENKALRSTYTKLQNQINEKKMIIEKLKKMREEELEKYEIEKKKLESLQDKERTEHENATGTNF